MSVEMTMIANDEEVTMYIGEEPNINLDVEEQIIQSTNGTTDYSKLDNIPTFNGVPLVGDIIETDPTVPEWAKKTTKPEYNPEEIGAINVDASISISDLASMFNE